jgi:hypothetical protein
MYEVEGNKSRAGISQLSATTHVLWVHTQLGFALRSSGDVACAANVLSRFMTDTYTRRSSHMVRDLSS